MLTPIWRQTALATFTARPCSEESLVAAQFFNLVLHLTDGSTLCFTVLLAVRTEASRTKASQSIDVATYMARRLRAVRVPVKAAAAWSTSSQSPAGHGTRQSFMHSLAATMGLARV